VSPRRYRMDGRRAASEAIRQRIVVAAAALHAEKGALATGWDEIAAGAGVSRATVYHHFPSLDTLVPACAQLAFDLIEVPTPEMAGRRFAGLPDPEERLADFVEESCRCYAAGAGWLRAAWRERDLLPAMEAAVSRLQRALAVLLDAALAGVELGVESRRVLMTLLDFPFWDALDQAGVLRVRIPARILELAESTIKAGR
jgi:AcrR family transcriptional regulator